MGLQTFSPTYNIAVYLIISRPDVLQLSDADKKQFLQTNFQPVLNGINDIYAKSGLHFTFDVATGVEYDAAAELLEGDALQQRAVRYRGKMVIFFRGHGGNSGGQNDYFHLEFLEPLNCAHEIGHYLHLNHTFFEGRKLSDLPPIIRKGVEEHAYGKKALDDVAALIKVGVPLEGNLAVDYVEAIGTAIMNRAMDLDASFEFCVSDTPAALHEMPPAAELPTDFDYCQADFPIQVTFSNGYAHTFHFRPDMFNVMSYGHFGGCRPRYFSDDQSRIMRYSLTRGSRRHLLTSPPLKWSGWSQVSATTTTDAAVTAAALGGRLYLVAKGINDNRIYITSTEDGHSFGGWNEVQGAGKTDKALAAVALNDQLVLLAKGVGDKKIHANVAPKGKPFGAWRVIPDSPETDVAPAGAAFNGNLYVFDKRANKNDIAFTSSADGQNFGKWVLEQGEGTTNQPPAAVGFGTRLYLFAKGIGDSRIYVNSSSDGKTFGKWKEVKGDLTTDAALAAVVFGNRLYLFAKGKDNRLYYNTTTDGSSFAAWVEVPGNGLTDRTPAVAVFNGSLYLFAKGIGNNRVYVNAAKPF